MAKRNPFKTKIDNQTYILGRYIDTDNRGEDTYFAVLINIEDGNRYINPITISENQWKGLCIAHPMICKQTIQMIKDIAVRLKGRI